MIKGILTGYGSREYGSGTETLRLFFAAVDFKDLKSTNVMLLDDFLHIKKAEVN